MKVFFGLIYTKNYTGNISGFSRKKLTEMAIRDIKE